MKTNPSLPVTLSQPLLRLRRRRRMVALGEGVATVTLTLAVLFGLQAAVDWCFEVPWLARVILLLADAAAAGWLWWRVAGRVLARRLNLAGTALLVEKKWTELRQCLITAVELGEGTRFSSQGSAALAAEVFALARSRTLRLDYNEVAPSRRLRWRTAAAVAAVLAVAGLAVWTFPVSPVLARRVLLSREPLPTRTMVEAVSGDMVVAQGAAAELRARARGEMPARGRVVVWPEKGAAQEFSIYPQAGADGLFVYSVKNVQQGFRYAFYLGDGRGGQFTVTVRRPPTVKELRFEQVWPAYTGLPPQVRTPGDLALLAGSKLRVRVAASGVLREAAVALARESGGERVPLRLEGERTVAAGEFAVAEGMTGLSVQLTDEEGVRSSGETVYPLTVAPDEPPVVAVSQPAGDWQTVTMRSEPVVLFTAADDYGVARLALGYQLSAPGAVEPGAARYLPLTVNKAEAGVSYRVPLVLASLDKALAPGWLVSWWIEATDNNDVTGPGVTKSGVKQLSIVTPEEKQAELFERLKQNADALDGLSDAQQKVSDEVGEAVKQN